MAIENPLDVSRALARIPMFSGFSADQLSRLVTQGRRGRYQPGDIVFQEGDEGTKFFLIERGLVKIYVTSREGQDAVLALLRPGEFFGELSLIDGLPRAASAAALEMTSTWEFSRADFLDLLRHQWDATQQVLTVLAARLRHSDGIIADAAFLDVRSRLAKRLLELAERLGTPAEAGVQVSVRFRQRELGELIGATRESTSRALSGLESMGAITNGRGVIFIQRPDLLRQVAGWV